MQRISFVLMTQDGNKKHEYTLGIGPCGKDVRRLELSREGSWLVIQQHHTDGTKKEFSYPTHLIITKVTAE